MLIGFAAVRETALHVKPSRRYVNVLDLYSNTPPEQVLKKVLSQLRGEYYYIDQITYGISRGLLESLGTPTRKVSPSSSVSLTSNTA